MATPILYSFRRCPYAMRARLALMHCGAQCILREVSLKDKPAQLLQASSKGTVPVLIVNPNHVLDESIDIMRWAIDDNPSRDTHNANEWQSTETMTIAEVDTLINQNDFEFKEQLDKYKYSDRHPEHPQHYYLEQALPFLTNLENKLAVSPYLGGSQFRFPDAAILPFIRQFSMVDQITFDNLALPNLQRWLAKGLQGELFVSVMTKYPIWHEHNDKAPLIFGR